MSLTYQTVRLLYPVINFPEVTGGFLGMTKAFDNAWHKDRMHGLYIIMLYNFK